MPKVQVEITWDRPDETFWLNVDNIKWALEKSCPNTNFEVVELETQSGNKEER